MELDRHLRALGVDSSIMRTYADLVTTHQPPTTILHLHELWLPDVHRTAAWARQHGVPIVWSTHGMTAPWSMRHKWWKKWPAWWLYQKHDLQSAALIHCTSEQEVEWNRRRGLGAELGRFVVAPLGTEGRGASSEFGVLSSEFGVRSSEFRVLFVGRVYPVKGLMNLVRAAAIVNRLADKAVDATSSSRQKRCENSLSRRDEDVASTMQGISFRIVGPDQAGHRAELEAECARLGVKNVQFVGEKHGAELDAEYAGCDVLVLPSFTENFGGVVVDALAHGKPVIASRFTPWGELEEKDCGWWVDNAPESLAKTIAEAASLPRERLAEMGEKGRKLVEAKYTWEAVAKTMVEGYGRVLSSGF